MSMNGNSLIERLFCVFCIFFLSTASLLADSGTSAVLAQNSDLSCGSRVPTDSVKVIDLRGLVHDETNAVSSVFDQVPDHGLQSPTPLLIEKAHVERRVRQKELLRDAVRETVGEAATRGCDLAILLDFEIIEKVMFRPQVMDLKLDVSYVLVLFGSQVKNSAQENSSK